MMILCSDLRSKQNSTGQVASQLATDLLHILRQ